jgi:hypothetical protein
VGAGLVMGQPPPRLTGLTANEEEKTGKFRNIMAKKILVVDDDKNLLEVLQYNLINEG